MLDLQKNYVFFLHRVSVVVSTYLECIIVQMSSQWENQIQKLFMITNLKKHNATSNN